ncbi:MAG: hypothetical protein H6729_02855 [Deltaproteobacteria bacterium]|nr:hypothetical protein [Deltaproteobacteria bacterium]
MSSKPVVDPNNPSDPNAPNPDVNVIAATACNTFDALDALWARHRQPWRRLFSRRVVRELELRAHFDLDLLSPAAIKNQIPTGQVPDCARCDDICCMGIENIVSLRLVDIARLIDIGRTDLIARKKPHFPRGLLQKRPSLQELVASELWQTLPVLKQNVLAGHRVCAALRADMRCTLYPNWPTSCERFPYTLAARRRIVWGQRCPSKKTSEEFKTRSRELFSSAVDTYNERIKDAVLLWHARKDLDDLGIGTWLIRAGEDPFEDATPTSPLSILHD